MRSRLTVLLVVLVVCLIAAPIAGAATALSAPTKVVRVGKQKVGYREFGSGRPLVMIMGLGGTMDSWDPLFLDALAAGGHKIVLLDNEGIGRTTKLPGKLSIRRMADTTAGLITRLRLKHPDVAGWSMGGMIAQSLAVDHPSDVRRLVLMATAPGDGKGTAPTAAAIKALMNPSDLTAALALLFPPDQQDALNAYLSRIVQRHPFEGVAPPAIALAQTQASTEWLLGHDPAGKRIAKLKMPTLVGGGELDQLLPFPNQQHLARVIPHAALVSYPDAAHAFLFQHEDDFVPRLLAFLG